jgi:hypothetical protein
VYFNDRQQTFKKIVSVCYLCDIKNHEMLGVEIPIYTVYESHPDWLQSFSKVHVCIDCFKALDVDLVLKLIEEKLIREDNKYKKEDCK